jgi:hypothetical protein
MTGGRGVVGVLDAPAVARVDERGTVELDDCTFAWIVGAEDRWHDARDEAAVRCHRLLPAPAYETRLRVPSGDAVQRVYGARGRDGAAYVVVEVENASPAPFAIAFVVRSHRARRRVPIALHDNVVVLGDRGVLVLPRPPMRWAVADGASGTKETVTSGAASEGPFTPYQGRTPEAAFVYPVAHRTTVRVALVLDGAPTGEGLDTLPAIDDVRRGWSTQLDRAMRAELPGVLGERLDGARASALLEAGVADVAAATIANLEDWGFDDEATRAWERASLRARRRAAERATVDDVRGRLGSASDEEVLRYARDALVLDRKSEIDLLPGFDPAWAGENLAVHDAPTREGPVSYAVRWHGERPALLWDAPEGVVLRAPALDPDWSATGGKGEALLAAWHAATAATGESFS